MDEQGHTHDDARAGHLEDLVNAIGGVIWEYDFTAEVYTFVSEGAEALLGYPTEAWLAPLFWTNHVHPEDLGWVSSLIDQMTERLETHEITYRMVHRNGALVWVREIITPQREGENRLLQRGILLDVTEQKVAEQAARHAESGFREMVEAGGRIAMKIDQVGRFTYVSSALCELAGKTEAQLLRTPFTQLLWGDERRRMMIAHRDHMSGREIPRSFRVHVKNAGGEVRLLELQTATLYDRDGRPSGATAMGEDITDRAALRQELERRAEEFDAVVRMLRDTYVRVNTDGTILDVKAVSSEAFLVELDAVLGKHAMQIFPPDHAEEMRQGAIESHETGETTTVEYTVNHDTTEQQFEARLFPLAEDATAMVIRDVTERNTRERELAESLGFVERLLSLIDSAVIVLRRSDLTILSANEPAERMFGYGADGLLGRSAIDLDPERTPIDEIVRRVRGQIEERGRYDTELQFVRRDGSIFDAEASVRPIDADGTQFLVVARDVTERHRNAEREREYLERLSALSADLVSAEDRERRRLAEELHDRVSQSLAVARMHLSAALDRAPGGRRRGEREPASARRCHQRRRAPSPPSSRRRFSTNWVSVPRSTGLASARVNSTGSM